MKPVFRLFAVAVCAAAICASSSSCSKMPMPQPETPAPAPEAVTPEQKIKNNISAMLLDMINTSRGSVGVEIWDAKGDSLFYEFGGKQVHRPASTLKLFTSTVALKNLGTDYAIKTKVFRNGSEIWVKGGFDPNFNDNDLKTLAGYVVDSGIKEITGLYGDVSLKDLNEKGYGWCWDDYGMDSPLLSPLLLNGEGGFMEEFARVLEGRGLTVSCEPETGTGTVPSGASLLGETSRTLVSLIPWCLKWSDNQYAEAFLYQMNKDGLYLSAGQSAINRIDEFMNKILGFKGGYMIVDGSGLSFYNLVTAEQEVMLLRYVYRFPKFYDVIRPALPVAGQDGTLGWRLASNLL